MLQVMLKYQFEEVVAMAAVMRRDRSEGVATPGCRYEEDRLEEAATPGCRYEEAEEAKFSALVELAEVETAEAAKTGVEETDVGAGEKIAAEVVGWDRALAVTKAAIAVRASGE